MLEDELLLLVERLGVELLPTDGERLFPELLLVALVFVRVRSVLETLAFVLPEEDVPLFVLTLVERVPAALLLTSLEERELMFVPVEDDRVAPSLVVELDTPSLDVEPDR